jgi:hypothetical protein
LASPFSESKFSALFCVASSDFTFVNRSNMHALISLFEAAANVLTGNFGLIHGRYSPKLGDFVLALCFGSQGQFRNCI